MNIQVAFVGFKIHEKLVVPYSRHSDIAKGIITQTPVMHEKDMRK